MDENYKKYLDYMYCYFEILNNIVKTFNSISYKTDENDPFYNSKHFFDITTQLLRLLPYKYVNEEIELKHDGIFLLDYNVEFICEKYSKIIYNDKYSKILRSVWRVRNKYMHEPHLIRHSFSLEGGASSSIGFIYKNESLFISTIELAPIIYYLCKIFGYLRKIIIDSLNFCTEEIVLSYVEHIKKYDFKINKSVLPEYLNLDF